MCDAGPFRDLPDLPALLKGCLAQIPRGRVTTCGALADALGNRIAARWVGYFMPHHEHRDDCPCHRVVRAGGVLGPYAAGSPRDKAERLAAEGVTIHGDRVDLDAFGFDGFASDRPLERLRRVQEQLAAKIRLSRRKTIPRLVAGVDVSYREPDVGVAAYALVDVDTGELAWSTTLCRRVGFPYVSTYLAFRELPILVDLLDEVRKAGRLAELLLVDGTGILHPRRAGIASHLGVAASVPTVGVTKKLLCGKVDLEALGPGQSRPVLLGDRVIGVALRATAGSRRPIFISPGHRSDVAFAERVVRDLLRGRRLPEPLYWADLLSRRSARQAS
jgi:deoxyribonuclease V